MHEIMDELVSHWEAGTPVALATVVATFSSAPRAPGASLLVKPDGDVAGSVSGGCVEGAVYDLASESLSGSAPQLVRYGFSDADAFAVGLTCGGIIDIFVQRIDRESAPWVGDLAAAVRGGRAVALATVVEHTDESLVGRTILLTDDQAARGGLGDRSLDEVVHKDASGLLRLGKSDTISYGPGARRQGEGTRIFVWAASPPPRLIIFGAIDFASALAEVGSFLGYRVTVCDARPIFATNTRFPRADEVAAQWPHRYLRAEADAGRIDGRTAICVLTHDPKFDVPVLEVALRLPEVGYVGAMGSRRTHVDRTARLREAGLTDSELARLCSPIGLDLGAVTPQETALSIAAEIVALRSSASSQRLTVTKGPIHDRAS